MSDAVLNRIQDAAVDSKTVLVRVDYNVPMAEGKIKDDARIRASLGTIRLLLERGAKVVLMSHLGRPDGQIVEALRLAPAATALESLLGKPVRALHDCVGEDIEQAVREADRSTVLLLENLRFHAEEEENDPAFAGRLAALADIYVDDAFGTLHRAHASTVGVARDLPAYAGLLVQDEVDHLGRVLHGAKRPYVAIVGGKKASSKLGALRDLVSRVDTVLIGGGVAFTFLYAQGADVGDSAVDEALLDDIREVVRRADEHQTQILLPRDALVAKELSDQARPKVEDARRISQGMKGFDIGPDSVKAFSEAIQSAQTVVWAGPMGAFEFAPFAEGTRGIAEAVAKSSAYSVIGGGETAEAVAQLGFADGMSYISTGGGASLAFLRGKTLPALEVLKG